MRQQHESELGEIYCTESLRPLTELQISILKGIENVLSREQLRQIEKRLVENMQKVIVTCAFHFS